MIYRDPPATMKGPYTGHIRFALPPSAVWQLVGRGDGGDRNSPQLTDIVCVMCNVRRYRCILLTVLYI